VQNAPCLPGLPAPACQRRWPGVLLQGLELLVTVLLARNRQPQPTVAAGVPHAELAAELVSLPSGLLAMVCEAIVKLKVRLGAAAARACGGGRTVCGVLEALLIVLYSILFRSSCVAVCDKAHGRRPVHESADGL
jgi:hypothetical protein